MLTEEFRDAFAKQCAAIGFDGAGAFVPHPVQNRTTAQLHEFANASVDDVLRAITTEASL